MKMFVGKQDDILTKTVVVEVRFKRDEEPIDRMARVGFEDKKVAESVFTLLQAVAKEVNDETV